MGISRAPNGTPWQITDDFWRTAVRGYDWDDRLVRFIRFIRLIRNYAAAQNHHHHNHTVGFQIYMYMCNVRPTTWIYDVSLYSYSNICYIFVYAYINMYMQVLVRLYIFLYVHYHVSVQQHAHVQQPVHIHQHVCYIWRVQVRGARHGCSRAPRLRVYQDIIYEYNIRICGM